MYAHGYTYPTQTSEAGEPTPPAETYYLLTEPDDDILSASNGDRLTFTPQA